MGGCLDSACGDCGLCRTRRSVSGEATARRLIDQFLNRYSMMKSIKQAAWVVTGTGLLVAIFWVVGLPAIEKNLSRIGAWFPVLVLLYLGAQLAFMAGWWALMAREVRAEGFLKLFGIYMAGDAINYILP